MNIPKPRTYSHNSIKRTVQWAELAVLAMYCRFDYRTVYLIELQEYVLKVAYYLFYKKKLYIELGPIPYMYGSNYMRKNRARLPELYEDLEYNS